MGSIVRSVAFSILAVAAVLAGPLPASAKDPAKTAAPEAAAPASGDDAVCGRDLMSADELAEHRAKMRSLAPQERAAYRAQHHAQMAARAQERGVTLDPMQCPHGGMGMGAGPGRGGPPSVTPPKP